MRTVKGAVAAAELEENLEVVMVTRAPLEKTFAGPDEFIRGLPK